MVKTNTKSHLQEIEYNFPYHHLVNLSPFSQSKTLFWGYEYASYMLSVFDKLTKMKFNSLVDVGCGDGRFLKEASLILKDKVLYGFDTSTRAINLASNLVPGIRFSTNPIKADVFTLIEVLEHINPKNTQDFLQNLPANIGIITVPTTAEPTNPKHYRHFNEESLKNVLSPNFRIISIERLNDISIGSYIVGKILSNRFFELRYGSDAIFRFYHKRYGKTSGKKGKRLMAVVENINRKA